MTAVTYIFSVIFGLAVEESTFTEHDGSEILEFP